MPRRRSLRPLASAPLVAAAVSLLHLSSSSSRLLFFPFLNLDPPTEKKNSQQKNNTQQKKPLQPVAKPDRTLQAREPGAARVPLSDVFTVPKTNSFFGRSWQKTDVIYGLFMLAMHALCLLAPATYSPAAVAWFFASYFVTGCLGITLSFHRQLSHRSFQTPKWLEYLFAYCGVLAVQGDPIEWASSHRFHHLHCDTPLDPHSPYEGFWWSHAGWLLDHGATMERVGARGNTADLDAQPFYRWVQKTYPLHVAAQFAALWALGGLPALVWAGALRICWVYHVRFFFCEFFFFSSFSSRKRKKREKPLSLFLSFTHSVFSLSPFLLLLLPPKLHRSPGSSTASATCGAPRPTTPETSLATTGSSASWPLARGGTTTTTRSSSPLATAWRSASST